MIFEDLVTTTNAMQSLQRKIAFKENKDKQDNTDGKYRLLLFKANGLVDTISFLYSNTAIPKDENLVESIKSLMDDLEKIVDTGLASHEGVLKAGTSFEEINEKLKIEWPSHYASLTNATFSTLEAIKDINPKDVETCLKKITSAKEWDLDVKRYERLTDGLNEANHLIVGLGLDDEILSFLQNTNSGKATLADLNEKVLAWIQNEGLENRIRISFVRTR